MREGKKHERKEQDARTLIIRREVPKKHHLQQCCPAVPPWEPLSAPG